MHSKRFPGVVLLSIIYSCTIFVLVESRPGNMNEERGCRIEFNNEDLDSEKTSEIVQECLNAHPMKNLNGSETEQEKMRIVIENQNNCALKCINENLNVTTADGQVDVSKILAHFQDSNATDAYVARLTALLNQCGKETVEKIQHLEGGFDANICKYHVMFMHCYRDAYLASRPEINKLC